MGHILNLTNNNIVTKLVITSICNYLLLPHDQRNNSIANKLQLISSGSYDPCKNTQAINKGVTYKKSVKKVVKSKVVVKKWLQWLALC